jgi:hypothetical protein
MSILDSLLTPKNIERGINLLQGNQGIVNTLTGLPIGPASARAYIRNLSGSTEPITEDFFNADQLAEIKNRTARTMADFSMEDPNERSWNALNQVVPYDMSSPISTTKMFTNPKSDITGTLGTYTYKKNRDGTISAIDKHDFDSFAGGLENLYGQGPNLETMEDRWATESLGKPDWTYGQELPFLPPDVDFLGTTIPEDRITKVDVKWQPRESVIQEAINAYKAGKITTSKLARIVGGIYGQTGSDVTQDYFEGQEYMRDDWNKSAIPVNINLGRISHLDKLRANQNFARYLATHKNIPSQIKKQAATHAGPISTAPINVGNPLGYGGGDGGYRASRPESERQHTGHGKSGMGRDRSELMATGGLINLYRYGGFI